MSNLNKFNIPIKCLLCLTRLLINLTKVGSELEHQVDLVEFCDLIQDDYTSEERKVEKQFEFKMNQIGRASCRERV